MKKTLLYFTSAAVMLLAACTGNETTAAEANISAGQSDTAKKKETVGQKLDSAIDKTSRKVIEVKDGADVLLDTAGNKIKDAAHTVKENVKDAAQVTKEKVKDAASDTKEAVKSAAAKTKEKVKAATAKAAEKVEEAAKTVKEKAKD